MRAVSATIGLVAVLGSSACTSSGRHLRPDGRPAMVSTETLTAPGLGFSVDKPAGDAWVVATDVVSPDGHPIPLVVAHASGAQIVIQVSEPVDSPDRLAGLLHSRLSSEPSIKLTAPHPLKMDAGLAASGFTFKADGDARGRVAIVDVGEHVVLVVASWPTMAGEGVVRDVDGLVRSVRTAESAGDQSL